MGATRGPADPQDVDQGARCVLPHAGGNAGHDHLVDLEGGTRRGELPPAPEFESCSLALSLSVGAADLGGRSLQCAAHAEVQLTGTKSPENVREVPTVRHRGADE